jgi:hypothetical protein
VPLGAFARPLSEGKGREGGERLELVAFLASSEGGGFAEARGEGVDPAALGRQVAGALQAQGIASVR